MEFLTVVTIKELFIQLFCGPNQAICVTDLRQIIKVILYNKGWMSGVVNKVSHLLNSNYMIIEIVRGL